MARNPRGNTGAWIATIIMIVGSLVLGLAFIVQSVPIGIAGVVIGLAGMLTAWRVGIMENVH